MVEGKFVDKAKEQVLYEFNEGGDVERMLTIGPVNSRVNEDMARWCLAVAGVTSTWEGKYHNLLGDINDDLQKMQLNLNAFSRGQALEMRGRQTIAEFQAGEQQKRGGLLGLSGGTK